MIEYIQRTRTYYSTLGYPAYSWANYDDVPFSKPDKSLAESKLVLVTTAAPHQPDLGDQGPGAAYNAAAKFFQVYTAPIEPLPDLRISHLGYDRKHSTAADPASFLPVEQLKNAERNGVIGELTGELIGVPTNRSQRVTVEQDAVDALEHCRRLGADLAFLVPT